MRDTTLLSTFISAAAGIFNVAVGVEAGTSVKTAVATSGGMSLAIDSRGYLLADDGSKGKYVGMFTSALQNLVDQDFPNVTSADIAGISFFNSSRY